MSAHEKSSPAELQSAEEPSKTSSAKYTHYRQEDSAAATSTQDGRINPDSRQMLWLAVSLVGFVGAISFMVSFAGLVAVAEWAGLPPGMRWTVPIFIDTAILVYSIAVLVHRSRGDKTWPSWLSLGAFTFVSVLANVGHVLLLDQNVDSFQTGIGAIVAGMAPIGVFAATEELGRLAIARPQRRRAEERLVQVDEGRPHPTPPTTPRPEVTAPEMEVATPVAGILEPVVSSSNDQTVAEPEPAVAAAQGSEVEGQSIFSYYPFDQDASELEWGRTFIPPVDAEPAAPAIKPAPVAEQPETIAESAKPALSAVSYVSPADQEQQQINELLAAHGANLTAKMIADALGKNIRTGQRKLTRIKAKHPEIFGAETTPAKEA